MAKKVIAVYENDNFVGYIKSCIQRKSKNFDLVDNVWDCKTYQSEDTANKAVSQYRSRNCNYSFVVKDFKL